jgi:uncharacterized membrane protein
MATYEEGIKVGVPARTAYNQWTQFEDFPLFMEGVMEVRQITDTLTHWVVEVGGVRREFDAEITQQEPDLRIAWHSVDGPKHAGVVTFHPLGDDDQSKVMLQMELDPEGFVEKAGDALGFVKRRVAGDLERFKQFMEAREVPTGAWRGEVPRS